MGQSNLKDIITKSIKENANIITSRQLPELNTTVLNTLLDKLNSISHEAKIKAFKIVKEKHPTEIKCTGSDIENIEIDDEQKLNELMELLNQKFSIINKIL
jgi:hypothetical protein